jgi:hypothetical protein
VAASGRQAPHDSARGHTSGSSSVRQWPTAAWWASPSLPVNEHGPQEFLSPSPRRSAVLVTYSKTYEYRVKTVALGILKRYSIFSLIL